MRNENLLLYFFTKPNTFKLFCNIYNCCWSTFIKYDFFNLDQIYIFEFKLTCQIAKLI